MAASKIRWPDDLTPERASVYGYNELWIDAPREHVWAWLVRAASWPDWYENAKDVRVDSVDGRTLGRGTTFTWTTFGTRLKDTKVEEYEPLARLSWRAKGLLAAYHGWMLEPDKGGVLVVTEETQRGIVPALLGWYIKPGLLREHQRWLEGLAAKARTGPPPK
jgi:hypothetical protein